MKFPSPHHASRPPIRFGVAVATVLAIGVTIGACGSDDESSDATDAPAATPPVATAAPATAAPAASDAPATDGSTAGGATVAVADSGLGKILVDGDGRTLYLFMPDAQGSSTCTDECLAAWPALVGPAEAGEGADASLLGTAPRPDDGTEQVTYDGWPLYYFAQDAAPGDTHGQGVRDVWYVVDATGAPIGADATPKPTTAGGY